MKTASEPTRSRFTVRGTVQGVGFRPFVCRLARQLALGGWVSNSASGVTIEVEGDGDAVDQFARRLHRDLPAHAVVHASERVVLDPAGYGGAFEIRKSESDGPVVVPVLPDIATCPECLREMQDPADRRYRYPFINCTHCGPRFSIIESLPYDRAGTTMRHFEMCGRCRAEYEDDTDRRYHAQPVACPECGPWLEVWDGHGRCRASGDDALRRAAAALRDGRVVALKGLGGFQLLVDARNEAAVTRLRRRKHRDEKPFALMAPALDWVDGACMPGEAERRLLLSPAAPITLMRRRGDGGVATAVAPGNPFLGVMLPCTPLHHLLMAELGFPVVATSGNIADEPIVIDEREALEVLGGIADILLVHNRPIARHVDDSVVRVAAGRELLIRRARGYAPLPIRAGVVDGTAALALGAHQKNTVALSVDGAVVVGQHIGDLSTASAFEAMKRSAADLSGLYRRVPARVACDSHPDYLSTRHAESVSPAPVRVQHHHAHVVSCAVENEVDGPFLGVAFDGTGYGDDATVWGGEFLAVDPADYSRYRRIARLRPFRLAGGEQAVREPRRSALGTLYELFGEEAFELDTETLRAFSGPDLRVVAGMLRRGVHAPVTTSAGRLFDAVASIIGLRHVTSFEGQAAMELEYLAHNISGPVDVWRFRVVESDDAPWTVDWGETIRSVIDAHAQGADRAGIAAAFHRTLTAMIAAVAARAGAERVVLSGGCFQNALLLECTVDHLERDGLRVYRHQRVPPNDGGISLGQAAVAAARAREGR